jgi:hypothetical protein
MCWLYCRRTSVPVIWLGPAQFEGMHAPMFGCSECIAELEHMIWQYFVHKDSPQVPASTR